MLEIRQRPRRFMPADFAVRSWDDVKPYIDDLLARPLDDMEAFQKFLDDNSELDAVVLEDYYWRYVRMTCNTADVGIKAAYDMFLQNIMPPLMETGEALNKKLNDSPFAAQMTEPGFAILLRGVRKGLELFREENIPLSIEATQKSSVSDQLRGAMMVELDGQQMTMQQAGDRLEWTDRAKREEAWRVIQTRFYADHDKFDAVFDEKLKLYTQIARNAGYDNFRDYQFQAKGRYDYTPQDCLDFHDAIEKTAVPLVRAMQRRQAEKLGLEKLRPWDVAVDPDAKPPLKAFDNADDLVEKGRIALGNIDPLFGELVVIMRDMGRFDLASRANKRPGGYNCKMPETVVPFVFANATQTMGDLTTFMHEMGHAVHSVLMQDLRLEGYRAYPLEVAEVASMAMELLSHDQWHIFFPDARDCRRARREHLENIIAGFPSIAQIDAFQHQVYTQPDLGIQDRHKMYAWLQQRFATGMVDWTDFADWREGQWQRVPHIFNSPFYYIEYGIAQLGALQLWRNYKRDPQKTIEQYKAALALGYTKTIPEIYEAAGIKFDFSAEMLGELMVFVQAELDKLAD